jgi:hypothetical protein
MIILDTTQVRYFNSHFQNYAKIANILQLLPYENILLLYSLETSHKIEFL